MAVSYWAKEQSVLVPTVGLASLAGKQQEALFIKRNRLAIDIAVALHLPVGNVAPIIMIIIAQIAIQVNVGLIGDVDGLGDVLARIVLVGTHHYGAFGIQVAASVGYLNSAFG